MTDPYTREERIAIRIDSHMTEREAIRLTDSEHQAPSLTQRIAAMAQHQKAQPRPLHTPRHAPIVDRKLMAAGDPA